MNNVWEFVRREDGRCTVIHDGKVLSDGVEENFWEDEFCKRFGFCGDEYERIVQELWRFGKCRLVL